LAIVPLVMKGPTTVFTHRGLSPHQFTPVSGAHKAVQATAAAPFVSTLAGDLVVTVSVLSLGPASVPDLCRWAMVPVPIISVICNWLACILGHRVVL
jgi:hypothetical protein